MAFRKKSLCLLSAVLCLCALLWACGQNAETPSSSLPSSSLSASSVPASSAAPAPSSDPEKPPAESGPAADPSPAATAAPSPSPEPARLARTKTPQPIYTRPAPGEVLRQTADGETAEIVPLEDPLWYGAAFPDGTAGYLYAETLYEVKGGVLSGKSLFEEYLADTLARLESQLPDGMYWNHIGNDTVPYGKDSPWLVTTIPCEHWETGELYCNYYNGRTKDLFFEDSLCQCLGFASFLSDQIFGYAPGIHTFNEPKKLRVGDHIRLEEWEHSMVVVEILETGVTVAEVNANYEDCKIAWNTLMTWAELEDLTWDSQYLSRYPLFPDGSGGFRNW